MEAERFAATSPSRSRNPHFWTTGELFVAASDGPWERAWTPSGEWDLVIIGEHQGDTYGFEATHDIRQAQIDAELIVRAVNAYEPLLAVADAAKHLIDRYANGDYTADDVTAAEERLKEAVDALG